MPASMPRKTPGKLPPPPDAAEFARLPLGRLCQMVSGVYYRLHTLDPKTRKLYGPVFFSRHGTSRFDPAQGIGTLCVADSLTGAILEKFGDRLEPLGSLGRALSRRMGTLLHGRAVLLRDHPELSAALQELEVGVIK